MKLSRLIYIGICLLLASCMLPPEYSGKKFKKTSSIDVFYSFNEVKRDYTVIGNLQGHKYTDKFIKENLSVYAKKVGADAIVIIGLDASKSHVNAVVLKYKPLG